MTYALGSLVCHQRPERSFHLGVYQLPVCARCLGIYAGAAVGALTVSLWRGRTRWGLALLAALPTAITVSLEWVGVWFPSNLTRAIAGAPLGLVVMGALATLHYGECVPPRPTAPSPPPPST